MTKITPGDEPPPFPDVAFKRDREEGSVFAPKFDASGLLTAVAVDAASGTVLMIAHMNSDALRATLETGIAHYWSRSRNTLWKKGETSGNEQTIIEILTDCDQDALVLKVKVRGAGPTCHTGRESCFYRRVATGPSERPGQPLEMLTAPVSKAD